MRHPISPKKIKPFEKPSRAWQRMLSGRRLDLLNPDPSHVEIEDIAHGLARVARWNGQTKGSHSFSVAQHSLLVLDLCRELDPKLSPQWQLAALLHDAPEYVIGDLISPFKSAIGRDYKTFELKLLSAIFERFSIPSVPQEIHQLIKQGDEIAAYLEATELAGFSPEEGVEFFGDIGRFGLSVDPFLSQLTPWSVQKAQSDFLARFASLCA